MGSPAPKNSSLIRLISSYALPFAWAWESFQWECRLCCFPPDKHRSLIEMDGLRYRTAWKMCFLDYRNRKQKHSWRGWRAEYVLSRRWHTHCKIKNRASLFFESLCCLWKKKQSSYFVSILPRKIILSPGFYLLYTVSQKCVKSFAWSRVKFTMEKSTVDLFLL